MSKPIMVAGFQLPANLVNTQVFLNGETFTREWLSGLDVLARAYAHDWDLTLNGITDTAAMSCCLYATTQRGTLALLKIPAAPEMGRAEAAGLSWWSKTGATPSVLKHDPVYGAVLMDRVYPGDPFSGASKNHLQEDLTRMVDLLRRLGDATPRTAGLNVPDADHVFDLRLKMARHRYQLPMAEPYRELLGRGTELLEVLLPSQLEYRLLHGDLHQKNVLMSETGRFIAIDPIPVSGERLIDLSTWVVLQYTEVPIAVMLTKLGETLGTDIRRLRAWAYVTACLSLRPEEPAVLGRQLEFITDYDTHNQ